MKKIAISLYNENMLYTDKKMVVLIEDGATVDDVKMAIEKHVDIVAKMAVGENLTDEESKLINNE